MKNKTDITFLMPSFKKDVKQSGVYKMVIDGKWFYIGSTIDLKGRLGYWKSCICLERLRPININKILKQKSIVEFFLIKELSSNDNVKVHENELLSSCISDPHCLNRCPSAFSPKGIKPCIGESNNRMLSRKPKCESKKKDWVVLQINKKNEIVAKHHGILQASKSLGGRFRDQICKLVNGIPKYKSAGGFVFVYEKNYNQELSEARKQSKNKK